MKELIVKKSKIHGMGLYVVEDVKKGETVGTISGDVHVYRNFTPAISKKILDWIGVGRFSWIDTSNSMYRYINHSCNPNVAIIGKRTVKALSNLKAGDEITMDYSITEAEPEWKIENCKCHTTACRKNILPIYHLDKKTIRRYLPNIPQNFQKIYEVENGSI